MSSDDFYYISKYWPLSISIRLHFLELLARHEMYRGGYSQPSNTTRVRLGDILEMESHLLLHCQDRMVSSLLTVDHNLRK